MTAKSDLSDLKAIRDHAVNELLERSFAGWDDQQIEGAVGKLQTSIRESLSPSLRKALSSSADLVNEDVRVALDGALHSEETLSFELKKKLSDKSKSAEKIFERTLAKEEEDPSTKTEWANEIPIWSGIRTKAGETRSNIDVGYSKKKGFFCLCELKINSGTPLYAMTEMMTYIHGYLIVRKLLSLLSLEKKEKIAEKRRALVEAHSIEWCVIAPNEFYKKAERTKRRLSLVDLERVRRVTQSCMERTAEELGFGDLCMRISLKCLPCRIPSEAEDKWEWIRQITMATTLRTLVLQAQPLDTA